MVGRAIVDVWYGCLVWRLLDDLAKVGAYFYVHAVHVAVIGHSMVLVLFVYVGMKGSVSGG